MSDPITATSVFPTTREPEQNRVIHAQSITSPRLMDENADAQHILQQHFQRMPHPEDERARLDVAREIARQTGRNTFDVYQNYDSYVRRYMGPEYAIPENAQELFQEVMRDTRAAFAAENISSIGAGVIARNLPGVIARNGQMEEGDIERLRNLREGMPVTLSNDPAFSVRFAARGLANFVPSIISNTRASMAATGAAALFAGKVAAPALANPMTAGAAALGVAGFTAMSGMLAVFESYKKSAAGGAYIRQWEMYNDLYKEWETTGQGPEPVWDNRAAVDTARMTGVISAASTLISVPFDPAIQALSRAAMSSAIGKTLATSTASQVAGRISQTAGGQVLRGAGRVGAAAVSQGVSEFWQSGTETLGGGFRDEIMRTGREYGLSDSFLGHLTSEMEKALPQAIHGSLSAFASTLINPLTWVGITAQGVQDMRGNMEAARDRTASGAASERLRGVLNEESTHQEAATQMRETADELEAQSPRVAEALRFDADMLESEGPIAAQDISVSVSESEAKASGPAGISASVSFNNRQEGVAQQAVITDFKVESTNINHAGTALIAIIKNMQEQNSNLQVATDLSEEKQSEFNHIMARHSPAHAPLVMELSIMNNEVESYEEMVSQMEQNLQEIQETADPDAEAIDAARESLELYVKEKGLRESRAADIQMELDKMGPPDLRAYYSISKEAVTESVNQILTAREKGGYKGTEKQVAASIREVFPNFTPEQVRLSVGYIRARSHARGQTFEQYVNERFEVGIFASSAEIDKSLQGDMARGMYIENEESLKAIIMISRDADFSTFIHELGHAFFDELDLASQQEIIDAAGDFYAARGMPREEVTMRSVQEFWASNLEYGIGTGQVQVAKLQKLFRRFMDWMQSIYESMKSAKMEIDPRVKSKLEALFTPGELTGERAPHRESSEAGLFQREYQFEGDPVADAYWIHDRKKKVYGVDRVHIRDMIDNPERFGLTRGDIEAIYEKHGERLGLEGQAREELILDAVNNGWIRARHYTKNDMWSFTVASMNNSQRGIENFILEALEISKIKMDPNSPIQIFEVATGLVHSWGFQQGGVRGFLSRDEQMLFQKQEDQDYMFAALSGDEETARAFIEKKLQREWGGDFWAFAGVGEDTGYESAQSWEEVLAMGEEQAQAVFETGRAFTAKTYHGTPYGALVDNRFDPGLAASDGGIGHYLGGKRSTAEFYANQSEYSLIRQKGFLRIKDTDTKYEMMKRAKARAMADLGIDSLTTAQERELVIEHINSGITREFFVETAAELGIDNYDTAPTEGVVYGLYAHMDNPYVHDMAGRNYSQDQYTNILREARDNGHDGVVMENVRDPFHDNVFIVFKGYEGNIKSADPVVLEENGNVRPLSRRFDMENADIYYQDAFHATPQIWSAEPGFPLGRPRLDMIGTGVHGQIHGWGFYTAKVKDVAQRFMRDSWTMYKLDISDDAIAQMVNEEQTIESDPRLVAAFEEMLDNMDADTEAKILRRGWADSREEFYKNPLGYAYTITTAFGMLSTRETSLAMDKQGIPGLVYADPNEQVATPESYEAATNYVVWNQDVLNEAAISLENEKAMGLLRKAMTMGLRQGAVEQMLKFIDSYADWKPDSFEFAPPGVVDEASYDAMLDRVAGFLREGTGGRFWYEVSTNGFLRIAKGNAQDTHKLVQLAAVFSPQSPVLTNTNMMLKAWARYQQVGSKEEFLAGGRIKTGAADRNAAAILYDNKGWGGRKTNSFYNNLMYDLYVSHRDIWDELGLDIAAIQEGKVTADLWMYRSFGYHELSESLVGKYGFVEDATRSLAAKLNRDLPQGDVPWTPHQVQAAIWVSAKIRWGDNDVLRKLSSAHGDKESRLSAVNKSIKSHNEKINEIKSSEKKAVAAAENAKSQATKEKHQAEADALKQEWREIRDGVKSEAIAERKELDAFLNKAHWELALEMSADEVTRRSMATKNDYSAYINRATRTITAEAIPSPSLDTEILNAPAEVQKAFTEQAFGLIIKDGKNELAEMLGLDMLSVYEGVGTYNYTSNPNLLFHVTKPTTAKEVAEFEDQVSVMARSLQYIYKQDSVPWVAPDRTGLTKSAAENNRYRVQFPSQEEGRKDQVKYYNTMAEARVGIKKWQEKNLNAEAPLFTGGEYATALILELDHSLTIDDMRDLSTTLSGYFKSDMGLTRYSENTVLVVNYRDDATGLPWMENEDFLEGVSDALQLGPDGDLAGRGVKSAFEVVTRGKYGHDQQWGEADSKETMASALSAIGSPDIFEWADSRASEFEALLEEYSGPKLQQKVAEAAASEQFRTDLSRRLLQPTRDRSITNQVDKLLADMYYELHAQDAREAIGEGRYVPYSVLGENASEAWAQDEMQRRMDEAHILSGGTNDEAAVMAEMATAAGSLGEFVGSVDIEYDGKATVAALVQRPEYDMYHLARRVAREEGNDMFRKALRENAFLKTMLKALDDISEEKLRQDRRRYGKDSIITKPALMEAYAAAAKGQIPDAVLKAARKIINTNVEEFRRYALSHMVNRQDLRKRKSGQFEGREGIQMWEFATEELRRMAREEGLGMKDSSSYEDAAYDIPTIKAMYGFSDEGIALFKEYGVFSMSDLTEEKVEQIIEREKQRLEEINHELAAAGNLHPEVLARHKKNLTDIQRLVREIRDTKDKDSEAYNVAVRLLQEAKDSSKEAKDAYDSALKEAREKGDAKAQEILVRKNAQIARMKEVRRIQVAREKLKKVIFSSPNKYMKSEYGQLLRSVQRLVMHRKAAQKHRDFDMQVYEGRKALLDGEVFSEPEWLDAKIADKEMRLSMDMLRELALYVVDLREAGRRRKQSWKDIQKQRRERAAKIIMDSMLQGESALFDTEPGRPPREQLLKRHMASTINAQRLWDKIDGMAGFKGEAFELGWNMTKAAEAEALKEYYRYTERLNTKMAELGLTPEKLSEKVVRTYRVNLREFSYGDTNLQEWAAKNGIEEVLDERTEGFTYNEIIGMYLALQDENTAQTMIFGNKLPLKAVARYTESLTDEMKVLGDFMQEQFNDLWPRIQAVSVDEHDVVVNGVERYMPIMLRGRWNGNMTEQMIVEKENRGTVQSTRTPQGFMSTRVSIKPEHRSSMRLDMVGVYMDHMRAASRYLHVEQHARLLGSVINNSDVSAVARQKNLSVEWKELQDWYDAAITKRGREHTIWDFLRRNSTISLLAWRPVIMVRQMASLPYYLAAGRGNLLSSAGYALTHWGDIFREVTTKDPFMRERSVDRDIERVKEIAKTDPTISELMFKIGEKGMRGIMMFDRATTIIGWHAVYSRAIDMGMSEQDAIAAARNVTARTQPVGGAMDVPAILRSGSPVSLLTQFSSQLNNIYGQMTHDTRSYLKSGDPMSAFLTIASIVIGQWIVWGARNGFDYVPDEEGDIASFLRELFFSPVPIVGPMVNAAFDGYSGSLPSLGFIDSGTRAVQRAAKLLEEGGDSETIMKIARDLIRSVGPFTGLPVVQVDNVIRAVTDSEDPIMRAILNFERD